MGKEIELKLALNPARVAQFCAAVEAAVERGTPKAAKPSRQHLDNLYFDTPDRCLNRHAVALRVRDTGAGWVQTLKTRGQSQGGLHQRDEWEWPVADERLHPELLPAEALPPGLAPGALQPAFRTDFTRLTWRFNYQGSDIELVLDSGAAISGERRAPISEIELELKQGESRALYGLALALIRDCPLHLCDVSKAERGYRLWAADTEAVSAPPLASQGTLAERCQAALHRWAWAVDRFGVEAQSRSLQPGLEALGWLERLREAGNVLPAHLRAQLGCLPVWRARLEQALSGGSAAEVVERLDDPEGCAVLLELAAWCYQSS